MKYLIGVLLLFTSTTAWCCSCFGTAPIEVSIAWEPILVEGQVVSLEQVDSPGFGKLTYSATLRVAKVLRGSVGSREITVVHSMCYASLTPDNMEMHHTYVLPLSEPAPEVPPPEPGVAVAVTGPEPGQYEMPGCAHSGLEVIDGDLYTFEYDKGLQRRLQRYMSYSAFRVWLPVAVGTIGAVEYVGSLYTKLGLSALALTLIVGTAGAYFAAKYRPWLLIPVLLLAIVFWGLNLGALFVSPLDARQQGALYWGLSLITPAIILGGVALGYRTRRRAARASL